MKLLTLIYKITGDGLFSSEIVSRRFAEPAVSLTAGGNLNPYLSIKLKIITKQNIGVMFENKDTVFVDTVYLYSCCR